MTTARNGYSGSRLPAGWADPVEDMAAYDRLPSRLRGLVAAMPTNMLVASVEAVLARNGEEMTEFILLRVRALWLAECRRLSEEACAL